MASYIEYVLCSDTNIYNIPKASFFNILNKHSRLPQSTRHFARYYYDDLVYESSSSDIKTYRKAPISSKIKTPALVMENQYNKENVPFYMFPSTTQLLEVMDVDSVVIRYHNNVFLNFEIQTHGPIVPPVYKIYVNHNVETRDDPDTVQKHITRALSLLQ